MDEDALNLEIIVNNKVTDKGQAVHPARDWYVLSPNPYPF